jgi:O-6-methylguanine DNA methyltransferase
MEIIRSFYDSPIGILTLLFNDACVIYSLQFGQSDVLPKSLAKKKCNIQNVQLPPILKNALDEYFAGQKNAFANLQLYFEGTEFQTKAWEELRKIPYGQTISYQEQTIGLGSPKAMRAIGQANNKNPIAIIIPCHRVIGKNGKMVGFGGGIDTKEKLLAHEARFSVQNDPN